MTTPIEDYEPVWHYDAFLMTERIVVRISDIKEQFINSVEFHVPLKDKWASNVAWEWTKATGFNLLHRPRCCTADYGWSLKDKNYNMSKRDDTCPLFQRINKWIEKQKQKEKPTKKLYIKAPPGFVYSLYFMDGFLRWGNMVKKGDKSRIYDRDRSRDVDISVTETKKMLRWFKELKRSKNGKY